MYALYRNKTSDLKQNNPESIAKEVRFMQVRVAEFVGNSNHSWQDAVEQAVSQASKRFPNISGVEVVNWTASCQGERIAEYKADIKIAYTE